MIPALTAWEYSHCGRIVFQGANRFVQLSVARLTGRVQMAKAARLMPTNATALTASYQETRSVTVRASTISATKAAGRSRPTIHQSR